MLPERFLKKIDSKKFRLEVYKNYLTQRTEKKKENFYEESVDLEPEILEYLIHLSTELKCSVSDVVNIVLREKAIELEVLNEKNKGFDCSISTLCLEQLLKESENDSELEDEIFKHKMIIVDSNDLTKKVVLIPSKEYEDLKGKSSI